MNLVIFPNLRRVFHDLDYILRVCRFVFAAFGERSRTGTKTKNHGRKGQRASKVSAFMQKYGSQRLHKA